MRTAAGAARYGVAIGEKYTEGATPQRGEDGPRILLAKRQLQALGLLPQAAAENSPHFGRYLQQGVRLFQQRNGLPVTGQLDAATQRRLNARAASGKPGEQAAAGAAAAGRRTPRASAGAAGRGDDAPAGDPPGGKTRRRVLTKRGDTLQAIAERELGDASRWRDIAKASGLPWLNPQALPVGTELTIPRPGSDASGGAGRPRAAGRPRPASTAATKVPALSQQTVVAWMRTLNPSVRRQLTQRARQILAAQGG